MFSSNSLALYHFVQFGVKLHVPLVMHKSCKRQKLWFLILMNLHSPPEVLWRKNYCCYGFFHPWFIPVWNETILWCIVPHMRTVVFVALSINVCKRRSCKWQVCGSLVVFAFSNSDMQQRDWTLVYSLKGVSKLRPQWKSLFQVDKSSC